MRRGIDTRKSRKLRDENLPCRCTTSVQRPCLRRRRAPILRYYPPLSGGAPRRRGINSFDVRVEPTGVCDFRLHLPINAVGKRCFHGDEIKPLLPKLRNAGLGPGVRAADEDKSKRTAIQLVHEHSGFQETWECNSFCKENFMFSSRRLLHVIDVYGTTTPLENCSHGDVFANHVHS